MESEASIPFSRVFRVSAIPETGLARIIRATDEEREAIARWLELEALAELAFDFVLRREGAEGAHVGGVLRARLTQTCVVTLDPLEKELETQLEARFSPADTLPGAGEGEIEIAYDPDTDPPEPIRDGTIDLGQFIYETLAAEIDPYPRKPGAQFEWTGSDGDAEEGPFAALKPLKTD